MLKRVTLFITALFAALLLTTTASADAINSPDTAAYISSAPQTVPANSTQWYKFDYAGDKSLITIVMPNANNSLVEFNVFTPDQAQSWWEPKNKPIGRGTAYTIDCETGEEIYYGDCQSNDLKWKGQFNFPGTFYVQVANYNTGPANFTLNIQGTGVHVAPAPQPIAPPAIIKPVTPLQTQPVLPTTGGTWWSLLNQKFAPQQLPRK